MHPARVVAEHAAERAVIVGRRIGTERQAVRLRGIAQGIEDDAGLDAGKPPHRIHVEDTVVILRHVDDDGLVAALAGEAGAAAARQHRRAMPPAHLNGCDYIVRVTRDDHADRDLPIIGAVRRIQRAAAGIETHFAGNRAAKVGVKICHICDREFQIPNSKFLIP